MNKEQIQHENKRFAKLQKRVKTANEKLKNEQALLNQYSEKLKVLSIEQAELKKQPFPATGINNMSAVIAHYEKEKAIVGKLADAARGVKRQYEKCLIAQETQIKIIEELEDLADGTTLEVPSVKAILEAARKAKNELYAYRNEVS